MAASSAGRFRRDVTLTFDHLTPKPNQNIFVPSSTDDKSLAKIHQWILDIKETETDDVT